MLSTSHPVPHWVVDAELVRAIKEKHLVEFSYKRGPRRIVEPHDYGIQRGVTRLLGYQVGGFSRSGTPHGWRMFEHADLAGLEVLDRTFPGSREDADQRHRIWDQLFARVT
jgi:hypothetical protein